MTGGLRSGGAAEAALIFGQHRLLRRLGAGGMAEVFLAEEMETGAQVALKRILPHLSFEPAFIDMFADECRLLALLDHPNISRFVSSGEVEDELYLTMEYIDGPDLRELLVRQPDGLPLPVAAFVVAELCSGLEHAHQRREPGGAQLDIIHRNVVPANVMLTTGGAVKLIDFGIARAAQRRAQTEPGVLKGLFGYLAPEQVRGLGVDQRSDLFGVGAVLYEACTGRPAFIGSSDMDTLERVRNVHYTSPRQIRAQIPAQLEALVAALLAASPAQRPQTAGAVRDALHEIYASYPDFSRAGCVGTLRG